MKKILPLFFICIASLTSFAQSPKFNDAMSKALKEMDTVKTAEQFLSVSNKFERIALAEKNQWLPFYYAALARVTSQFIIEDHSKTDEVLDVAQKHANTADSLSPNNSEIMVLKSMILGGRIMVDPMTRGQLYGMQSMMLINQAMQTDPNNPRAYFVMGQSLFYTPVQFGGGKDPGCKMMQTAKEKYAIFKPASPLHPNWGEEELDQQLKQCSAVDPNTGKHE